MQLTIAIVVLAMLCCAAAACSRSDKPVVTPNSVKGAFVIEAAPQWPQTNDPSLDVTGNFAANRAENCATT